MKSLVLIGDAPPHQANENPEKICWKEESEKLANRNIQVFSVQCLNKNNLEAYDFYSKVAQMTNGYHMYLDQFSYIKDMLQAICFRQYDKESLIDFENQIQNRSGGMNNTMRMMFDVMLGKKSRQELDKEMNPRLRTKKAKPTLKGEKKLSACLPSKFQVFNVDETSAIQSFCSKMGIRFRKGRGFYEFIKTETIQPQKEIVLMEKSTGNLYEGEIARIMAGIPKTKCRLKPADIEKYKVFIQTTSNNRKLIKDQGFLYEVAHA
jgi:hypothetical protein